MVVVTRSRRFAPAGVRVAHSLKEALDLDRNDDEPFIGGGAHIYRMALENDLVDRIYLTRVHAEVEGDTVFPEVDLDDWDLVSEEHHEADERNEHPYSFLVYERRSVGQRS
jgi:dihydrofolate reductase